MQRPLDVLGNAVDKRIIIKLKAGEEIIGVLKAFDSHLNIWLEDVEIKGEKQIKTERALIRGDNIILILPGK